MIISITDYFDSFMILWFIKMWENSKKKKGLTPTTNIKTKDIQSTIR